MSDELVDELIEVDETVLVSVMFELPEKDELVKSNEVDRPMSEEMVPVSLAS